ncbi:MAG: 3-oxoacyl-ACP reductase [Myxococcota bacterium]
MKDLLLELSKNDSARNIIKSLGLPIPMPQELQRARGPRSERQLSGRRIAVWSTAQSQALPDIAKALDWAGARMFATADSGVADAVEADVEALDIDSESRFDGLVLDATTLESPSDLRALYDFFHPLMRRLARSGRLLVVGRPVEEAESSAAAAARGALEGFVRSTAKEVGKKGSTAQLVYVDADADSQLAGPLRFVLSEHSAYVSGQVIRVSKRAGDVPEHEVGEPLAGKTALVTGAARGIGAATAEILANEGADVICLDLPSDEEQVAQTADRIGGHVMLADVTAEQTPARIAKTLAEEHGGLDVIVHNAGITRDKTLKNMKSSWWDQAIEVNLRAVVDITEQLIEDKVLNDYSRVICLSSIAGISGNMGQTNYAASKSGIIGFVEHLGDRLDDCHATVNAIAPGFIETRLTEAMPVAVREVARRMNNLGQGGKPEDVGQAIAFLATPGAQGVTGQVLRVCGGAMVGK